MPRCIQLGLYSTFASFSLAVFGVAGCATQTYPTLHEHRITLQPGDLEAGGIAFVTPSSATGQEQERQAVAFTFAEVLKRERPKMRVRTLAEVLGAVNEAGLANTYKRMYDEERDTGLLSREVLRRIGEITTSRYIAQLKLQGFSQGKQERFGALGLRIVDTQYAQVRVFLQIWDSNDGTIAWEGMQELRISSESISDQPVTLRSVLEHAALDLVARLP